MKINTNHTSKTKTLVPHEKKKSKITNRWSDSVCGGFGRRATTAKWRNHMLITNLTTAKSTNCRRRPLHLTPLLLLAEEAGHPECWGSGSTERCCSLQGRVECRDGGILEKRRRRGPMHTSNRVRTGGGGRRARAESRRPTPLHEWQWRSGCEVGEWRRERGEETEEQEVGEKRWSGFGQGILDRTGARGAGGCWFEMDGAVHQLLGRVRASAWLGKPDHGALVGWVHFL
jgi:hypothetical protein